MSPWTVTAQVPPVVTIFTGEVLPAVITSACVAVRVGIGILRLPFDAAREQYAQGVQAGLIGRSMLASRDLECALGALEQLTLGPLARRV